eukprot:scaffold66990_cov24-Phaeocystis_antarctica.AAC.1
MALGWRSTAVARIGMAVDGGGSRWAGGQRRWLAVGWRSTAVARGGLAIDGGGWRWIGGRWRWAGDRR